MIGTHSQSRLLIHNRVPAYLRAPTGTSARQPKQSPNIEQVPIVCGVRSILLYQAVPMMGIAQILKTREDFVTLHLNSEMLLCVWHFSFIKGLN